MPISISVFKTLRPQQCILSGPKSTHNVCICKTNGNIRLKLNGLKQEFSRKKYNFQTNYRDYLCAMTCTNSSAECYLGNCENCPGTDDILDILKTTLQEYNVETISYNQWLTTDRFHLFIYLCIIAL